MAVIHVYGRYERRRSLPHELFLIYPQANKAGSSREHTMDVAKFCDIYVEFIEVDVNE